MGGIGVRRIVRGRGGRFVLLWTVFVMLSAPVSAAGAEKSTNLANFAPERDLEAENRPIFAAKNKPAADAGNEKRRFALGERGENAKKNNDTRVKTPQNAFWSYLPVLLLVVCLGCGMLLMLLRKWYMGGKSILGSPALEIIGRTQVDRNKCMVLVRVGKRVLVLGINPNGFDVLSEISEPAEVAELMVEARPQSKVGKNVFIDLFRKHVANEETPGKPATDTEENRDAALNSIQERIRTLRQD